MQIPEVDIARHASFADGKTADKYKNINDIAKTMAETVIFLESLILSP